MRFENKTAILHTGLAIGQEEIRRLPQFLRASPEYVNRLGGHSYHAILDASPIIGNRKYISIDSRVHMLMPGFLPCIGGWHCDDFHRPMPPRHAARGQPDLLDLADRPELQATHHALILGADVASTIFAAEPFDLTFDVCSSNIYRECHRVRTRDDLLCAEIDRLAALRLETSPGTSTSAHWIR